MGNFRDGLDALAALDVTGVIENYGIDRVPEQPERSRLPALLVLTTERAARLFPQRGEGMHALALNNAGATYTAAVAHLLLIAPEGSKLGLRSHLPALADAVDAYFSALLEDPLLGGALAVPPSVQVEAGTVRYNGTVYSGVVFRHLWTLEVA